MKGKRLCTSILAALIAGVAVSMLIQRTTTADPDNVMPGIDLWTTPGGGTAFWDFSAVPVPADFFGPGSDPFDGVIALRGAPLPNLGGPSIFPADTVVERLQPAILPTVGSSDTVDIEMLALRLGGTDPIEVTYNGGTSSDSWDVHVALSSSYSQTTGTMTIRHECAAGGTFDSALPVQPKFTFIHQSGTMTATLDHPAYTRVFTVTNGRWVHSPDASFNVVKVAAGAVTDGDADGSPDPPLPPTSNFSAGIWPLPCQAGAPTTLQLMRLTPQTSTLAAHGVIIAFSGPPTDTDSDSVPDIADNCRTDSNPLQEDSDDNGFGDACQTETYLPVVLRDH
jgi:hypothetical protein